MSSLLSSFSSLFYHHLPTEARSGQKQQAQAPEGRYRPGITTELALPSHISSLDRLLGGEEIPV